MRTRQLQVAMIFCSLICQVAFAKPKPHAHYHVILPSDYVGWVQVIFNDPAAASLPHDHRSGAYDIDVPENGTVRTSDLRVHDFSSTTELVTRNVVSGMESFSLLTSAYYISGDSLGGFGQMDTCKPGSGYSWFFFIGPAEIRSQFPKANWEQYAEGWFKLHGNRKVIADGTCPAAGNIRNSQRVQKPNSTP